MFLEESKKIGKDPAPKDKKKGMADTQCKYPVQVRR